MYYIGISAYYHESSVFLTDNQETNCFLKEESFSRIKGDKNFPQRWLKFLIKKFNLNNENIYFISFYEKPFKSWWEIFYYSINNNESKHDHLVLYLSKGFKLIYNDVRKFGFLKLIKKKNIFTSDHLKYLGPEPLTNEFNLKYIIKFINNKRTSIKDLLMNQKFVSGLGNIYCNEILCNRP